MSLSDDRDSIDREPTPLEQAALEWVVRCDRGLSAGQERALREWLDADPRHREAFDEFGGTFSLMGRLREDPGVVVPLRAAANAHAAELTDHEAATSAGRRRRHFAWVTWSSLAAAAALVLGVMSFHRPTSRPDPAIATEIGRSRELTLSDGSVVALNTDSALVPDFAADERRVRLERGEAFFHVAKDAARPFIVEAAGIGVRAVGTAFNVRVHPAAIEVLVTEGIVRVAPSAALRNGGAAAEVVAGEQVIVPIARAAAAEEPRAPAFAVAPVAKDEVARRLAWQGGRLDFSDATLGEMVAEFNRYNRHKLVVPDAELAAMRFGGSFRPDDRVGFVRVLHESFGIVAEESGDQTILRRAAR